MSYHQDTTLSPIKHNAIKGDFTAALAREGVAVIEDHDLGYLESGGYARLLHYLSPNSGRTIYALELTSQHSIDDYESDIWQFAREVTPDEAREFAARQREVRRWAALLARRDHLEALYARALQDRSSDVIPLSDVLADIEAECSCSWPRPEPDPDPELSWEAVSRYWSSLAEGA